MRDDGFSSWNKPFESQNAAIQVPQSRWTYCSRSNVISKSQCMANGRLDWWRCAFGGWCALSERTCTFAHAPLSIVSGAPLVCASDLNFRRGRAPLVVLSPWRVLGLQPSPMLCQVPPAVSCFQDMFLWSPHCLLRLSSHSCFSLPSSPIYRVYLLSHANHAPACLVSSASPACPFSPSCRADLPFLAFSISLTALFVPKNHRRHE